jgi:hypothetical protein
MVTGFPARFGAGPTIAVAFGVAAGVCVPVLQLARADAAVNERHLSD